MAANTRKMYQVDFYKNADGQYTDFIGQRVYASLSSAERAARHWRLGGHFDDNLAQVSQITVEIEPVAHAMPKTKTILRKKSA